MTSRTFEVKIKPERSEWVDKDINPPCSGVYEVRLNPTDWADYYGGGITSGSNNDNLFAKWDANTQLWGRGWYLRKHAASGWQDYDHRHRHKWRGLTIGGWMEAKGCVERGEDYE